MGRPVGTIRELTLQTFLGIRGAIPRLKLIMEELDDRESEAFVVGHGDAGSDLFVPLSGERICKRQIISLSRTTK